MKRDLLEVLFVMVAAVLMCVLLLAPKSAHSEAIATAQAGKVIVTLRTEPCALKAITNLPQRATWLENGKISEGCWGASGAGVVMTYWDDSTVAVIPFEVLRKAEPEARI